MTISKPDALVFDMDGTLWDAVDTYTFCWNKAFEEVGYSTVLEREELLRLMGIPIDEIMQKITPGMSIEERKKFVSRVHEVESRELPVRGGRLFDGVKSGIEKLSRRYKLFLLSNCEKGQLQVFAEYAGIAKWLSGTISFGDTSLQKGENMRLLQQRFQLKNPVYIGDTEGDAIQTRLAGWPFVFVRYGFGSTDNFDLAFGSFAELTDYFMNLS